MVSSIANITSQATQALGSTPSQEMGKDEFLQLLVAQLRNQDPLEPMQDMEFIAQMAQFSELEQIVNMNDTLNNSIDVDYITSQSIANSMVTSLLGKTVTADSDLVYMDESNEVNIHYSLGGPATEVKISIYSETGELVDVIYDDYGESGMNEITWDGRASSGSKMPQGSYRVDVEALSADGTTIAANPFLVGEATRVQYMDGAAYLIVAGQTIMLGDVVEIEA